MKYTQLAFVFFILLASNISAQSFSLSGNIVDSLATPIEVATVILLQEQDSVMAGFSVTNAKGKFKIDDLPSGNYLMTVSYLGYADYKDELSINADQDLGNIKMILNRNLLDEVTVTDSYIPVKIKNDTIEYNANAFKTQANDNVEELLKKLPGIEVADDGTIKAHGEEVEKVLVEGKEFFGNDPTIATKNLPADAVEAIQVFDKQSDMAEFTGVDDGQRQKTLNIALKEGKKAGYFGKADLGYGTDDRYKSKFTLNRFDKMTQLSAIGMANNVNEQGFSFKDYIDLMGGLGNLMGGGRINSSQSGINISDGLGDGFVNTFAGGANFNIDLDDKQEINSSYFVNNINNTIDQNIYRENLLGINEGFITDQSAFQDNKNLSQTLNITYKTEFDSTQKFILRFIGNYSLSDAYTQSNTLNIDGENVIKNNASVENKSNGKNLKLNADLTYTKRLLKKGRFLSTNLKLNQRNSSQEADLNSTTIFNESLEEALLNQFQSVVNNQTDYAIKVSYTEPLGGKKYLTTSLIRSDLANDYDKQFFDINGSGSLLKDYLLSNAYRRDYNYNTASLNLKYNPKIFQLSIEAGLQQSVLKGLLKSNNTQINQSYLFVLPSMNFNYNLNRSSNLRLNYRTSINEPSLTQLQPIIDNSDPLNVYQGNPELDPSYRHNISLRYNIFSQFSSIGFFSNLNATYINNPISNTTRIDENLVKFSTPINTDKSYNLRFYGNFNAPLKFIKHRISFSDNFNFNNGITFINGVENVSNRTTHRLNLSLENLKNKIVSVEYGGSISFNNQVYSNSSELNQNYINYSYFTDLSIELKERWEFSSYFRNYIFSNESFGEEINIPIWNASVSRIFCKNKKFMIELSATDLLNRNQNINRSINSNYIQEQRIESIGRYFMAQLSYNFSGFGAQNSMFSGKGRGRGRGR